MHHCHSTLSHTLSLGTTEPYHVEQHDAAVAWARSVGGAATQAQQTPCEQTMCSTNWERLASFTCRTLYQGFDQIRLTGLYSAKGTQYGAV